MAKVAAKAKDRPVKKKQTVGMKILTILFSIVSVFYSTCTERYGSSRTVC